MLVLVGIVTFLLLTIYIWLFNFFHFIPRGMLIARITTAQSRNHMIKSALSFGFLKASFRNFLRHAIYLKIFPEPVAKEGSKAPDAELITLNGKTKVLSQYMNTTIVDMYRKYGEGEKKVAEFLTIYIEEAHAKDDWKVPAGANPGGEDILMHRVIQDRITAGKKFVEDVQYPVELVCDTMKAQAMNRYEALPERLYILEQGVVVYKGGGGPFLYKPEEVLQFLKNRFGER